MRTVARHVLLVATAIAVLLPLIAPPAGAQSNAEPTAAELAKQIQALKREYEARIGALEAQLSTMESKAQDAAPEGDTPPPTARQASDNAFNPAIGVVLNGMVSAYSANEFEIHGFPTGHESERAAKGLSLGHSEIALSGNIDDKFLGNLTLGLGVHPGEPTELDLEEAYIQTLPGAGLPEGMRIKAGRALWTFGYLNEQHAHGDDFVDRPLPYRAFLDNAYNDDGAEVSLVLATDLYSEVGVGAFRGDDIPFAGSDSGRGAWSAFARLGGDFGRNSAWRIGGYVLDGKVRNRGGGHGHGDEEAGGHAHEADEHEDDEHAADEHEADEHEAENHHDDEKNTMTNTDTPSCSPKACSVGTRGSSPSTFAPPGRRPETRGTASWPCRANTSGARKRAPTSWLRKGTRSTVCRSSSIPPPRAGTSRQPTGSGRIGESADDIRASLHRATWSSNGIRPR